MPTRRRLTVLVAPGGFGKTTLFAECCRRARGDGIPVAWVSVDEQDEPEVLDTYIACACRSAAAGAPADVEDLGISVLVQAGGESGGRTALALREIEARDGPFVLVFDELERLGSPDAGALLEFLLRRGPPNLHLAFSGRELPAGVNVTGAVLDGQAEVLSADDLRFSSSEAADFFGGRLSGRRLDAVMSESAGWPFALRLSRNELERGGHDDARASRKLVENWVESRLFAGLGAEDREFLLDIGLFEWIDAALLDEVLERSDSMRLIDTMPVLAGLLEPVRDGATEVWRLHPLIREHCARRRFRETPQRFRAIHRRIAVAFGRRGQTVAAMRHAVEAGEPALAGDLLEDAGGVRLYHREGVAQLQAAHRLLTEDAIAERPRLALVRCMASILSGRMDEAREGYRSLAGTLESLLADAGDAGLDLAAENCIVRGTIALFGRRARGLGVDPPASGRRRAACTIAAHRCPDPGHHGTRPLPREQSDGEFTGMRSTMPRGARRCLAQSRYMSMAMDVQEGQAAMAQGRVRDATALYRRAERVATERYVLDPEPAAICSALMHELALECGRVAPGAELDRVSRSADPGQDVLPGLRGGERRRPGGEVSQRGRRGRAGGPRTRCWTTCSAPGCRRWCGMCRALRVSLLAVAAPIGDAERAWESADLPPDAAGCLDLAGQSWREMEALSSARLRLAIGGASFEEARRFAGELRTIAAARGLTRTLMRALALSAVLERRAGDGAAAAAHVEAYLGACAETPYAVAADPRARRLRRAPGGPSRNRARLGSRGYGALAPGRDGERRRPAATGAERARAAGPRAARGTAGQADRGGARPERVWRASSPAQPVRQARGAQPGRGAAPGTGDGPDPRRLLSGLGSERLPAERRRQRRCPGVPGDGSRSRPPLVSTALCAPLCRSRGADA